MITRTLLSVFLLFCTLDNSFARGSEPSQAEMHNAMVNKLGSNVARSLGIEIDKVYKKGCQYIEENTYRCAYTVTFVNNEENCRINPIACLATMAGRLSVEQGVFIKYVNRWVFSGAGT